MFCLAGHVAFIGLTTKCKILVWEHIMKVGDSKYTQSIVRRDEGNTSRGIILKVHVRSVV